MISKDDRKCLIMLCDRFINSGDDVTLTHLLDVLNTVIPDANSQESDGSGASSTQRVQHQQLEPFGKPGEWNIESFL